MVKAIAFLLLLLISPAAYAATTHIVGGSDGWTTGVDYDSWATGQDFTIGDTLLFDYDDISHAVYEVNVDDCKNCDNGNPINVWTSNQTNISLSGVGERYFICPRSNHCDRGMKLEVIVTTPGGGGGGAPRPSPTLDSTIAGPTIIPTIDDEDESEDLEIYTISGITYWRTNLKRIAWSPGVGLKLFRGDTLGIKYDDVTNAVYEVSLQAYNDCNSDSPINVYTSSPTMIKLTTAGRRYFINPRSNKCRMGQKFAITVSVRRGNNGPNHALSPSGIGNPTPAPVGPMD